MSETRPTISGRAGPERRVRGGRTIEDVCVAARLSEESLVLLTEDLDARAFAVKLIEENRSVDAMRLLAHILPARDAVWWALCAATEWAGEAPAPAVSECLVHIRAWFDQPTDVVRRAAWAAAREAGLGTPAGLAGMALFCSDGSVAPPEAAHAPARAGAVGDSVAGATGLAAANGSVGTRADRTRAWAEHGLFLADNADAWRVESQPAAGTPPDVAVVPVRMPRPDSVPGETATMY